MNCTLNAKVLEVSRMQSEVKLQGPCSSFLGIFLETDPSSPTFLANETQPKAKLRIKIRKCHTHLEGASGNDSTALGEMAQKHLSSDKKRDCQMDLHSFSTFCHFHFVSASMNLFSLVSGERTLHRL